MCNQPNSWEPNLLIIGTTKSILIIVKDKETTNILSKFCKAENYQVIATQNGLRGWAHFQAEKPDLILLDWDLPALSGREVCMRIRAISDVPIFILSSSGDEATKLRAFEIGADDFLTAPFSPREVMARIRINFRRFEKTTNYKPMQGGGIPKHGLTQSNLIGVGSLIIDKESRTVSYDGQIVKGLTNKEYELLITFIWQPGRVITIADLETALYGL